MFVFFCFVLLLHLPALPVLLLRLLVCNPSLFLAHKFWILDPLVVHLPVKSVLFVALNGGCVWFLQLFAQVRIMEEDTLMKAPRAAFGLMAPVYKRSSGSAERATPAIQESQGYGDHELHHESEDEFERENLRATGNDIHSHNR